MSRKVSVVFGMKQAVSVADMSWSNMKSDAIDFVFENRFCVKDIGLHINKLRCNWLPHRTLPKWTNTTCASRSASNYHHIKLCTNGREYFMFDASKVKNIISYLMLFRSMLSFCTSLPS